MTLLHYYQYGYDPTRKYANPKVLLFGATIWDQLEALAMNPISIGGAKTLQKQCTGGRFSKRHYIIGLFGKFADRVVN